MKVRFLDDLAHGLLIGFTLPDGDEAVRKAMHEDRITYGAAWLDYMDTKADAPEESPAEAVEADEPTEAPAGAPAPEPAPDAPAEPPAAA
jgi:hypothetical protein